jgi:hypothetical protein
MHQLLIWAGDFRIHASRDPHHLREQSLEWIREDQCCNVIFSFETQTARDDAYEMLCEVVGSPGVFSGYVGKGSMWVDRTFDAGQRTVDRYRQWVSLVRQIHRPNEDDPLLGTPSPPWCEAETELRPDC